MKIKPRMKYMLDEQGNVVEEPNLLKWAAWFEDSGEQCIVARNIYTWQSIDILVSTFFLAVPSPQRDSDEYALFQTTVFAPNHISKKLMDLSEQDTRSILAIAFGWSPDIEKRYQTREEAVAGHKQMCNFIQISLRYL